MFIIKSYYSLLTGRRPTAPPIATNTDCAGTAVFDKMDTTNETAEREGNVK